jgi:hypothetical protein
MLEMFILNPPLKSGKTRRVRVRRSGSRSRRLRNSKTGRFLKNSPRRKARAARKIARKAARKMRRHRDAKGHFASNPKKRIRRSKPMAVRTRRRKAGRRRYRRNAWFRQSRDHAVAAKLGWAYQTRRRKKGGAPRRYILGKVGRRGLLRYRAKHKVARRRKSARKMVTFRVPMFGRRYKLVANKRRRSHRRRKYMDNARSTRRRRRPARGAGGKFVARRSRSKRRFKRNWFVYNDNAPKRKRRKSRRSRRSYRRNWFVYNDNSPKRRRRSRRRRYANNARRHRGGRRFMRNDAIADALDTVKSVFDVDFLTGTALPVVGGFFASRLVSGVVGAAAMGANYTGAVRHIGNLVSSGLAAAAVGFIVKDPQIAGNVLLGGVVNAIAGILRDLVGGLTIVTGSPALSQAFGLSGMGDMGSDIRSAVEREVMKELGVSDFLSAEQLSRSERIGDFLSAEQLSRSERIGQYPAETAGPAYLAQYPEETSGGAMSDFADVASFGG